MPNPPEYMCTYKKKRPRLKVDVTKRFNRFHLEILNPSKNGVFRSPTYQVKSFWKIWQPVRNTSTIAFNLDLVVGVSHPHELKMMSPLGSISAMRLPWSLTDVYLRNQHSLRSWILTSCCEWRLLLAFAVQFYAWVKFVTTLTL